jgi:hypothetical protein
MEQCENYHEAQNYLKLENKHYFIICLHNIIILSVKRQCFHKSILLL